MKTPVIRFTGSPDSDPAQWLRINELTTQPGPGSAYRVTIEPIEADVWEWKVARKWIAGITEKAWENCNWSELLQLIQSGAVTIGSTREEVLTNLAKAKARGPL